MTDDDKEPPSRTRRRQCRKCPWKVGADPTKIPLGYDRAAHRRLTNTIARVGEANLDIDALHIMACHESPVGRERPCIGWLHNQLTDGDNVLVRYLVRLGRLGGGDYVIDGEQHLHFEDTLPKEDSSKPARKR